MRRVAETVFKRGLWEMGKAKKEYYAVVKGRVPGIYTSWSGEGAAEEQTKGFPKALFKGFDTKAKASLWFQANGGILPDDQQVAERSADQADITPVETPSFPDPATYIPEDAKTRAQFNIPTSAQIIYTDGACPSNGLLAGRAGIGIFFHPNSPYNLSARLPGPHQTNQRAELYAVLKALEHLHTLPPASVPAHVVILTDSSYVVRALTEWVERWAREGWRTAGKRGEVVSRDLFQRAKDMLDSLGERGVKVELRHVPGHKGVWGNEMADRLAVRGAWMEAVKDMEWEEAFDDAELDQLIAEMEGV